MEFFIIIGALMLTCLLWSWLMATPKELQLQGSVNHE